MARTEARLRCSIWDDVDYRSMSMEAQWLYQAILSQKDLSLCGVLTWTAKRFAKLAANATPQVVKRGLEQLRERRYVVVDDDTDELWVRTFVRNDRVVESPNAIVGMSQDFGAIHSHTIRQGLVDGLGEGFLEGLPERFPNWVARGFPKRLARPFVQALSLAYAGAPPRAHVPPASSLQPPASSLLEPPNPPPSGGQTGTTPRANGTNPRAQGTNPRGPKPLDPLEAQSAAQRAIAERQANPCLECGGSGWTLDDEERGAVQCSACNPVKT